ncbi:C39 family peptidase [Oryzobacter telluris]|uniref:C39 family peptidase n=1 Tax=Oryzobacter telluris TaxID=3149179 RepID=UPI00370D7AB8
MSEFQNPMQPDVDAETLPYLAPDVEPPADPQAADGVAIPGEGQVIPVDADVDGIVEGFLVTHAEGMWTGTFDTTGDGEADVFAVSTTGAEVPDFLVSEDGSGGYIAQVDTDGDGVPDTEVPLSRDQLLAQFPEALEYLDLNFAAVGATAPDSPAAADPAVPAAEGDWSVVDGQLIGDPAGASEHWFEQAANGFCVPASVTQMVAAYTGTELADESFFVERANELHLFTVGPDGSPSMTAEGAATLLMDVGIDAHVEEGLTILDLENYLDEGRPVMLAVDSGEMWYAEGDEVDDAADHAVVLTGIDPVNGVAIISDPGSPTGDVYTMSLADLNAMWEDSGRQAVIVDAPDAATDEVVTALDAPVDTETVATDSADAFGASADAEVSTEPASPFGAVLPGVTGPGVEPPTTTDGLVSWLREHPSIAIVPILAAGGVLARRLS